MALPTLDDPFYYLVNFRTVLDWLKVRYADLLAADERAFIATFGTLPQASQALLVRMVMRKGIDFRASRLAYAEIGDPTAAVTPLIEAGFVGGSAPLSLEALFALTTKPELGARFSADLAELGVPKSRGKNDWLAALQARAWEPRPFADWLPMSDDRHYRLGVDALCERFRLMFFGNLRQQWSEFVLADLGVYRFETVELDAASRAFSRRGELEVYHRLHACRERFEAQEPLDTLLPDIPRDAFDNAWLERRRGRLVYKLAYRLERQGELAQALALYEESSAPEARVRRVRVLESQARFEAALKLAEQAAAAPFNAVESQFLERILPRLKRKLGRPRVKPDPAPETHRLDLELPRSPSVELAAARHLSTPGAPVYYVENTLINALFGLLCWEAIFAPLPGAFFHPFHVGPADLHEADFHVRRREIFDDCLARLQQDGNPATEDYRDIIRRRFHQKFGIQSPFVFWEGLDEALLELALHCIPPSHLRLWFERLLGDIRANRAGMPDLIQFWPDGDADGPRYRMIEVKGPGDRLQDNQRRWLEFCAAHAMPVSVCYVRWKPEATSATHGDSDTSARSAP